MAVPGRRRSVPTDLIIAARDAPLPWGSGMLTTLLGFYPENRGSVPRHSTHSGCKHECAYEPMSA